MPFCVRFAAIALCAAFAVEAAGQKYADFRPEAPLRMPAEDAGRVLRHGPEEFDRLGARDVWVYEDGGKFIMHYDAAGPTGWLVGQAESTDLVNWKKRGTVLDLGTSGSMDSASASYGTTYKDEAGRWHMFYLGTPNVSPAPNLVPMFPYTTMKAQGETSMGPWTKQYDVTPFRPAPGTYYEDTASPGAIVKQGDEYLQFFSASRRDENLVRRTLGIARTKDLNGPWKIDANPIVPLDEQIENSSLYFEPANGTWFLFTNHIGKDKDAPEYTDSIWVYWTRDLNYWDARHKAVVLDGANCGWSKKCIGLPSVVKHGDRLAVFYDAPGADSISHMQRDIGLAWLDLPLQPPAVRDDVNPAVEAGLQVLAVDGKIVIEPGRAKVGGAAVDFKTTMTLAAEGCSTEAVRDEETTLPVAPSNAWVPGAGLLKGLKTTNMIPGALLPGTVSLRLPGGEGLQRDKDFVVDETWAKIGVKDGGKVSTDTQVLANYEFSLLRVDGIDLNPDGRATLIKGEPHLVCPVPPAVTTGSLRLANVFRPYGCKAPVESWHLFPIGKPFAEPSHEQEVKMSQAVRKTLGKLRSGEPVTIVTWGDSVTVGGDTSKPELAFANQFIIRLKERFPQAKITHVNASIGGTTTQGRLPDFEKEVMAHKPDLVTIEFVNDMSIPHGQFVANWNKALARIKEAGGEAIVITPHFTMPGFMGNALPRGTEMRPAVRWLKMIARDNGVGLADTSRRWEHLETEGIPYTTLLWNGINHPNDAGHELFVKDLMAHFPAED